MDKLDEDNCVKRATNGDGEAFAQLLEAYYDMIYRTAYKWCGAQADAEDVAQNVCMKLADAITGFRQDCAFSSWVYRITVNAANDLTRKRRGHSDVDAMADSLGEEDNSAEQRMQAQALWQTVQRLPDKQAQAVLLVYSEELSHAAVAEIMECKESTVSWYIHEAKKQLNEWLQV